MSAEQTRDDVRFAKKSRLMENRLTGFGFLCVIALAVALLWFVFGERFAAAPDAPSGTPPSASPNPQ